MAKAHRSFAVIGLGSFGAAIVRELSAHGDHVLGIDRKDEPFAALKEPLARSVICDGRDIGALQESGIGSYDVVVIAISNDVESSLLTVMNLKQIGVETIWAEARDDTHEKILNAIGISEILRPELDSGVETAVRLHNPNLEAHMKLFGDTYLGLIRPPDGSVGMTIGKLDISDKFNLRMMNVIRDGARAGTEDSLELRKSDLLLVMGTRDNMRAYVDRG